KLEMLRETWLQTRAGGFARQVQLPSLDRFLVIAVSRDPTLQSIKAEDAITLLRESSFGGEGTWGRFFPKGPETDTRLAVLGSTGWNTTPDIGLEYTFRLVGNTEGLKALRENLRHRIIAMRGEQRWLELQNEIDLMIDRINNSARNYVDSQRRAQMALADLNRRWDEYKRSPGKILWSEVFKIEEDVKSPEAEYRLSLSTLNRSRAEHKTAVEDFVELIRALGVDEGTVIKVPTYEKMAERPAPEFATEAASTPQTAAARQEAEALNMRLEADRAEVERLAAQIITTKIKGFEEERTRTVDLPSNWSEAGLEHRTHRPLPDLTGMNGASESVKITWEALKGLRDATRQPGAIGRRDPARDVVNLDDITWFMVNQRIACNRAGIPKSEISEDLRYMSILAPHVVSRMNAFFESTSRAIVEKYIREKVQSRSGAAAAAKLTAAEIKALTDYILVEIRERYGVTIDDNLPAKRPARPANAGLFTDDDISSILSDLRTKLVLDPFLRLTYEGLLDESERNVVGLNTLSTMGIIGYYRGKIREALMPDGWVDAEISKDPTPAGIIKLLESRLENYPELNKGIRQRMEALAAQRVSLIDRSIIERIESRGDPSAVSPRGAVGLRQIMPCCLQDFNEGTGKTYTMADMTDPAKNREVSDWYFDVRIPQLLTSNGLAVTQENILRAYNQGVGGLASGAYPEETQNYVAAYRRLAARQAKDDPFIREARELLAQAYVLQSMDNDLQVLSRGWQAYFINTYAWTSGDIKDYWINAQIGSKPTVASVTKLLQDQLKRSPKVGEGLKDSARALINRMAAGKTLSPDMLQEAKDILFDMQFQEYANLLRTFKYNVWTYEFNGMLDVTYWNMISKNYRRLAQHVWPGDTMYLYGDLWSRGRLISLAQMLLTNDFTRDPKGATLQPSKRADEFVRFAEKLRTSVNNFNAEPYEIEFNNIVSSLIVSKGARAGQVVIVESSFRRLLELIEKGVRENLAGMVKIDFSELERLAGMCRSGINEGTISEQDKIALIVEAKNVMDQIQAGR
ncbi:MAG: lytic transglycosylase domain-containing protein, partial [Candidatus Omnitrophota bacterium]